MVPHDFLRYFAYGPYYDRAGLKGDNAPEGDEVRLLVDLQSPVGFQAVVEDRLQIAR